MIENKNNKIVSFITLGCKVNQYETNAMAQKFKEKGYKVIEGAAKDRKSTRLPSSHTDSSRMPSSA